MKKILAVDCIIKLKSAAAVMRNIKMGTQKINPKELRHIRKVTLVSENDIEAVGGHSVMNKILTSARDIAVTKAKSNALPTYNKTDSDFINKVQDQAMSNSELGKTKEEQDELLSDTQK